MPLYYFHIRNGSALERDPEGMKLPDLESAHAEALVLLRIGRRDPEFNKDTLNRLLTRLVVPFCWFRFPKQQGRSTEPALKAAAQTPGFCGDGKGCADLSPGHTHDPSGPFLPHGWPLGVRACTLVGIGPSEGMGVILMPRAHRQAQKTAHASIC